MEAIVNFDAEEWKHWEKAVRATTSLMGTASFPEFFATAAENLAELLAADGASLIVYDGPERLKYKLFYGLETINQIPATKFSFPAHEGTAGRVLSTGKLMFTADYPSSENAIPEFVSAGLHANLVLPLKGPLGYIGVLTVVWMHKNPAPPNSRNIAIAEMFAAIVGSAVYREELEDKLTSYSLTDPLTGLPNRRMLMHRLSSALRRASRNQCFMVVAVLDLDGFKEINDGLGHASGDQTLLQVADALKSVVRDVDLVARLGGDEFVIVLEELRTMQEVSSVLNRIVGAISLITVAGSAPYKITASLGATIYPLDFSEPEALLQNADKAMYNAKRNGGNAVIYNFDHP